MTIIVILNEMSNHFFYSINSPAPKLILAWRLLDFHLKKIMNGRIYWRKDWGIIEFFPPSSVAEPEPRIDFSGERCLSRASSLAILFGVEVEESPWDHTRAKMVLGPFAETKGPRRAGTIPRIKK
jgi:hypothetical protein